MKIKKTSIDEDLEEVAQKFVEETAKQCCGAGRHLIKISEDGTSVYYIHDSARERGGNAKETGEYYNLYEENCNSESLCQAEMERYFNDEEQAEIDALKKKIDSEKEYNEALEDELAERYNELFARAWQREIDAGGLDERVEEIVRVCRARIEEIENAEE